MALISLTKAKHHLRVEDNDHDADISLKLDQAEALIIGRCNSTAWWRVITPTWTDATVPGGVQSAILVLLTALYEHRGDDMADNAAMWDAIDRLIGMNRDPVLQ